MIDQNLIDRLIHLALYHHTRDRVSSTLPIDGLAYFSGLNLLNEVLTSKNFYTKKLDGQLSVLDDKSEVYVTQTSQKSSDDKNHYVLIAKVILAYRLESVGSIEYFLANIGTHNTFVVSKSERTKMVGTLLIPYDLVGCIDKKLMPIDVSDAIQQNPLHESFSYKLSPSPATSFAIDHDLQNQMAFITHPKIMLGFLENQHEEQLKSLSFDTRLALDLLNSKYNIDVNKKAMQELADIDTKLSKINGPVCIEIN